MKKKEAAREWFSKLSDNEKENLCKKYFSGIIGEKYFLLTDAELKEIWYEETIKISDKIGNGDNDVVINTQNFSWFSEHYEHFNQPKPQRPDSDINEIIEWIFKRSDNAYARYMEYREGCEGDKFLAAHSAGKYVAFNECLKFITNLVERKKNKS